jgi:hypothetical protein
MMIPPDPHAQPLHDWLEARAAGQVPPTAPDSDQELADLLATAHQLDHLAHRVGDAALQARSFRHRSWEDHMSATAPAVPTPSGISTGSAGHKSQGWTAPLQRWHSAISFIIMLAILGSLFAIAYQRGMQGDGPEPTMLAALQDDATPADPAASIDHSPDCVAQDLGAPMQINGQWSSPNYTPAYMWTGDPQPTIYRTFLSYLACQNERDGGERPSDDERTFLSPRLLFLLGSDEPGALMGPGTNQDPTEAAADVWGGQVLPELFDPTQRIISDFPLPLNRTPMFGITMEGEEIITPFGTWDIYTLPNYRWAVIGGSISTHMLQTGVPIRTGDGEMFYVSFIAQGDGYVIDEFFLICPSDITASLADDDNQSLQQEPFDPAELIRNRTATCG